MANFVSRLGRPRKKNSLNFLKSRVRESEASVEREEEESSPVEEPAAEEPQLAQASEDLSAEEVTAAETSAEETSAEETAAEETTAEEPSADHMEEMSADPSEAEAVFGFFREITAIPRGSGNVTAIGDYLVRFAEERKLEYRRDEAGNVIIRKPGTGESDDEPGIVLQGHMDIVCEQEEGRDIDMTVTPPQILQEGDWLTADGTTLGADNGIAVAMMLALLDDGTAIHPQLECIFTVDEEVGMLGAQALDLSDLQGRMMLNLDSEDEGVITAGCAGGAELHCIFEAKRRKRKGYILSVGTDGLLGGHSGDAINRGRANADLVTARVLYRLYREQPFRLIYLIGGNKDNAIPRSARAEVLLPSDTNTEALMMTLENEAASIRNEYRLTDPGLQIHASLDMTRTDDEGEEALPTAEAFSRRDTRRFLRFLAITPNGVQEYDPSFPGLPQTSLNLGILRTEDHGMTAVYLLRSSVNSQRRWLESRLGSLVRILDGKVVKKGEYPAWEFRTESPFRDELIRIYRDTTGTEPSVAMIHGGLECGLLAAKVPGLDCVSMGPNMRDVHTPAEKLSISSTVRTWKFLLKAMADLAG